MPRILRTEEAELDLVEILFFLRSQPESGRPLRVRIRREVPPPCGIPAHGPGSWRTGP
jgi:hypothetical protein